jgi:hypothetical protein
MGHSHHIACKQVLIIEWQNLAKAGKTWQNLAKAGKTWQKLADKTEHGS